MQFLKNLSLGLMLLFITNVETKGATCLDCPTPDEINNAPLTCLVNTCEAHGQHQGQAWKGSAINLPFPTTILDFVISPSPSMSISQEGIPTCVYKTNKNENFIITYLDLTGMCTIHPQSSSKTPCKENQFSCK